MTGYFKSLIECGSVSQNLHLQNTPPHTNNCISASYNPNKGAYPSFVGVFCVYTLNGDGGGGVELLGNPPTDAVQLHPVDLGAFHTLWEEAHKIARATGRVTEVARGKAQIANGLIDGFDNHRRGVEGGEGALPGGPVLLLVQQVFEGIVLSWPLVLIMRRK